MSVESTKVTEYTERVLKILIVDDDATVRGVVADYLRTEGFDVTEASNGSEALERIRVEEFAVVVLDLMLPVLDGLEVCRRATADGFRGAIIMLTAKDSEADRILGFELGADDYLTKPFSPRELVLRVRAILRRASQHEPTEAEVLEDGEFALHPSSRKVFVSGEQLELTMREFDLLAYFLSHPDEVLSREDLLNQVWGWNYADASTVTVHVRRLREKIEPDPNSPQRLVTVWGRGYRWEPTQCSAT